MSRSSPMAAAALRPRVFDLTFLFVLLAAVVVTVQQTGRDPAILRLARPQFQGQAQDNKPESAFDVELTMTPAQLMTRWNPLIAQAAKKFSVPEKWIRAVMRMESGGRTMSDAAHPITSSMGAMGLMQLMPQTYDEMRAQYGLGSDPYDAHDNIFAGAAYLKVLYRKYGTPAMFAAYNDGPGNLEDHLAHGKALPQETRAYVAGVAGIVSGHRGGTAHLTRPDGTAVAIAKAEVTAVRAPLPGEYADSVKAVVTIGKMHQGVRQTVAQVKAEIGVV